MLGSIKKIGKIFRYRKQLKTRLNDLYQEENLDIILDKYTINKLPEIELSELIELYSFKSESSIKVKTDYSGGISPVNDYYFLSLIAKALNTKRYFEIGTWVGLSAYNIANNLGKEAEIYSLDIPADHAEIALFDIPNEIFGYYSKDLNNVHFLKSDSKKFDFNPYKKQFDMVFVDGNHTYDYVKNDTKIAYQLLKGDNSVIAWHDYFLGGELNKKVLAGILDALPDNQHKHVYSLYQSNLAVYSKKYNFEKKYFDKWNIPKTKFTVTSKPDDA
jgi:predicted O-methyltransferase YrrM